MFRNFTFWYTNKKPTDLNQQSLEYPCKNTDLSNEYLCLKSFKMDYEACNFGEKLQDHKRAA